MILTGRLGSPELKELSRLYLCGSELSKILLNPSKCFRKSLANLANVGSAGNVSISFQALSEIQSSAGLGTCSGTAVPPARR